MNNYEGIFIYIRHSGFTENFTSNVAKEVGRHRGCQHQEIIAGGHLMPNKYLKDLFSGVVYQ